MLRAVPRGWVVDLGRWVRGWVGSAINREQHFLPRGWVVDLGRCVHGWVGSAIHRETTFSHFPLAVGFDWVWW